MNMKTLAEILDDIADAITVGWIVFCAILLLLIASVRVQAAPPPMYSLTTRPTYLANKGLAPAKGQNAIEITGKFHTIENIVITGGLHGLYFPGGASDITIANVIVRNPVPSGGGGYDAYVSNGGGLTERVDVYDSTFEIDDKQEFAQFPWRVYGARDFRFIRCKFTNQGKALKASFKLGEGKRVEFRDCEFVGWPPGIGRNTSGTTPDPSTYICEDIKFIRCKISMNEASTKNAPSLKIVYTKNGYFEDCVIGQLANVGVLDIGNGIDGLVFNRTTLLGGSKLGKTGAAKFISCTYMSKKLTDQGAVLP